ncbi:MAG: low molecular weight protein arginine phosphatase [Candidatus Thorarchaeota archaeon]
MNFPYSKILIACSVNTARSPMAQGFLNDFFAYNNMNVEVYSGGISSNARDGMLISLDAKLVMKEIGIYLSEESLSIDLKKRPELIKQADLILTLTKKHKEEILEFISSDRNNIFTLREFAGEKGDIEDPSMKGIEGFRKARDEIKYCIDQGMKRFE